MTKISAHYKKDIYTLVIRTGYFYVLRVAEFKSKVKIAKLKKLRINNFKNCSIYIKIEIFKTADVKFKVKKNF